MSETGAPLIHSQLWGPLFVALAALPLLLLVVLPLVLQLAAVLSTGLELVLVFLQSPLSFIGEGLASDSAGVSLVAPLRQFVDATSANNYLCKYVLCIGTS